MMKTIATVPLSLLVAMVAGFAASPATAQDPKTEKPVAYAVVQVGEAYQVIKADEVTALKDRLKQEFKAAVAAHKEAVKQAKANKEKAPAAPKAEKLKVIKPKLDEAAAKALVEQLKAKANKSAKKPAKKTKRADPPKPAKDPKRKGGGK